MRYCTSCGTPIKDGDKFCCSCGAPIAVIEGQSENKEPVEKENGTELFGFGAEQGQNLSYSAQTPSFYGSQTESGVNPGAMNLPVSKLGIIGFVFSVLAFALFIVMFGVVIGFIVDNPQFVNGDIGPEDYSALMGLGGGVLACMFFGIGFAITGISVCSVGIAKRKVFRLNGFAYAGLVIGCVTLFIFLLLIISGT